MARSVRLGGLLFWLGLLLLVAAAGFLAASGLDGGEGFGDLARVVGAMVLAALGGAVMAGFLVAWRFEEQTRPAAWRLGLASAACVLAGLAAGKFLAVAMPQGNVPLALLSALLVATSLAGVAASGDLLRRPLAR